MLKGPVEMDPVKVSGVVEWPVPWNKKEVQSFIGFINFYWRFTKDLSYHTHALFNLTKKDIRWKWGELEQAAFDRLKELITSTPVLIFPDNSCPYCVKANSSNVATGVDLSQQLLENGKKWHSITFFSKSLSPIE